MHYKFFYLGMLLLHWYHVLQMVVDTLVFSHDLLCTYWQRYEQKKKKFWIHNLIRPVATDFQSTSCVMWHLAFRKGWRTVVQDRFINYERKSGSKYKDMRVCLRLLKVLMYFRWYLSKWDLSFAFTGLVHVSEMSASRVENASEIVDVGEHVWIKVIGREVTISHVFWTTFVKWRYSSTPNPRKATLKALLYP